MGLKRKLGERSGAPKYVAAVRLQRAFRKRRKTSGGFTKKVRSAVMSREPVQYNLKNVIDSEPITQDPVAYQLSDIYFDNTADSVANAKLYRTSNKVKVMNMNLQFRILAGKDAYNVVTLMLLRSKRSSPITNDDIQDISGGPLLTAEDKPFMKLSTTLTNYDMPSFLFGSSATEWPATDQLTKYTNPKVCELMWSKTVTVQPMWKTNPTPTTTMTTFPTGFTFKKEFEYNHRFNEEWKFPEAPEDTQGRDILPYNNKCYTLVAVSDSPSDTQSHPVVLCNMRMSMKDID